MLVRKLRSGSRMFCGIGTVVVLEITGGSVRLGFQFPSDALVCPEEQVQQRMEQANKAARFARLKVAGGTRDAA